MEYTVQKLGQLAGISTRTLRYYDEIGLLKPARINSSGYRIYGQWEVHILQQILFYRELDVSLEDIKCIITDKNFDRAQALREHKEKLLDKRAQLDVLIANVEKSIAMTEGRMNMTDQEKFEGFKQKMIDENEKKYGEEIREKYGKEAVNKSNAKLMNMTQAEYEAVTNLQQEFIETLKQAFTTTSDPANDLAQKAADLHRQWLSFYWNRYSKEAHAGLAQMYMDDERFKANYEKIQPGLTEFLRDVIHIYTGTKKS